MAAVYAEYFTPLNVAAISLWPGYVGTERMAQLMETDSGVKQRRENMGFESTELSRSVIRSLYHDPNLQTLSGKTIMTAEAAERYRIPDLDGPSRNLFKRTLNSPVSPLPGDVPCRCIHLNQCLREGSFDDRVRIVALLIRGTFVATLVSA